MDDYHTPNTGYLMGKMDDFNIEIYLFKCQAFWGFSQLFDYWGVHILAVSPAEVYIIQVSNVWLL